MSKNDVLHYLKNYRFCLKMYRNSNRRNEIYLSMAEDYYKLFKPVLKKYNISFKPKHRTEKRFNLREFFYVA